MLTKSIPTDNWVTRQLTQLLTHIGEIERDYEKKREAYHQEAHRAHQAEQKLLKLKRRFIQLMQENDLDQLNVGENLTARLVQCHTKAVIDDESAIPAQFVQLHRVIDQVKLKKALVAGKTISGVHLESTSIDLQLSSTPTHASPQKNINLVRN